MSPVRLICALAACAVVATGADAFAVPRHLSAKQKDIRELLDILGVAKGARDVANNILPAYRSMFPKAPDSFWENFESEIKEDEFVELLEPIYDKHLKHEDLRQILGFYRSSVGKRFAQTMPSVRFEAMQAGQIWSQQLVQRLETALKKKGYLPSR
jgi:hypothetical protein